MAYTVKASYLAVKPVPELPSIFSLALALALASFFHRLLDQTIFQPAPEELNYSLVENELFTALVNAG